MLSVFNIVRNFSIKNHDEINLNLWNTNENIKLIWLK